MEMNKPEGILFWLDFMPNHPRIIKKKEMREREEARKQIEEYKAKYFKRIRDYMNSDEFVERLDEKANTSNTLILDYLSQLKP